MELKRKCLVVLCTLLLLVGIGQSATGRVALVLETKGNNSIIVESKKVRMRTLQVLPLGASVDVPQGCRLRLSYFESGRKENIVGPCRVKITKSASEKIEGKGHIEVQAKRNATTELKKTENLRRMGGELQASVDNNPDMILASLEPQKTATFNYSTSVATSNRRSGSRITKTTPAEAMARASKPISIYGFGSFFLGPEDLPILEWKGGPLPTEITLRRENQVLATVAAPDRACAVDSALIQPGQDYIIDIQGPGEKKTSVGFSTLTKEEVNRYHRVAYRIRYQERNDRQSLFSQLIFLELGMGLWNRAERTALRAVEEFPDDSGFHFEVAKIQLKLKKKSQAKEHLSRAKSLESAE